MKRLDAMKSRRPVGTPFLGVKVVVAGSQGPQWAWILLHQPHSIFSSAGENTRSKRVQASCLVFRDNKGGHSETGMQVVLPNLLLESASTRPVLVSLPWREVLAPSQPRFKREPGLACHAFCPAWPLEGTHFLFPKNTMKSVEELGCSQVAQRALLLLLLLIGVREGNGQPGITQQFIDRQGGTQTPWFLDPWCPAGSAAPLGSQPAGSVFVPFLPFLKKLRP